MGKIKLIICILLILVVSPYTVMAQEDGWKDLK